MDPQEAMNYVIHTHTLLELKKPKVALPFAQRAVQLVLVPIISARVDHASSGLPS